MERGVWQATIHGSHKDLDMTEHTQTQAKVMCIDEGR